MNRRSGRSRAWQIRVRSGWMVGAVLWGSAVLGAGPWAVGVRAADPAKAAREERVSGRELFEREWLPGDSRAHGGDGLGPVYNDSSCIACHNLGGGGGGGTASKNVDIISASASNLVQQAEPGQGRREQQPHQPKGLLDEGYHATSHHRERLG